MPNHRLLLTVLFAAPALAVVPADVTITGLTGVQQTSRPVVLSRFFGRGEFTHFAKPSVSGSGVPAIWQNDVKTRWRDGTPSTVAVTGAATNAATGVIRIAAVAHGFQEGEIVTVSAVGGNTAANGTRTIRNVSVNAFDLINSTTNGAYTSGGTVTGPSPGSVQHALISFRVTVPASGSITVSFTDSTDQCSSGDTAACNAASLDAAGMLAFNGGTWTGTGAFTGPGSTTYNTDARAMLTAGTFTYWLRGPAATVVIAEDATTTRPNDFGWTCATNCTGDYSSATWTADVTNRSMHPIFVLSFFTGWAGVKIEYIMENVWTTALQDQRYRAVLSTSAGVVFDTNDYTETATGLNHFAKTRWRKVYWDGSEPGGAGNEHAGIKVNYNLAYIRQSHLVLPYDLSMDPTCVGCTALASYVTNYHANVVAGLEGLYCPNTLHCGNILMPMPVAGGRGDLGPITSWDVAYLYTWDPALQVAVHGNADIVGLFPVHWREMDPTRGFFDQAGTVPSLGLGLSLQARPKISTLNPQNSNIAAANRINPIAPFSTADNWGIDMQHYPSTVLVSYITTGDWWHWSNQRDNTHLTVAYNNSSDVPLLKEFALPTLASTRSAAWSIRENLLGAIITPDDRPEKNYFMQKFQNWISIEDGVLNNTASKFYQPITTNSIDTEKSPWAWGRLYLRGVMTANGWANPLGLSPGYGECTVAEANALSATSLECGKGWMWNFNKFVTGWAARLYQPVDAIRQYQAPSVISQVLDPTSCPYCASIYTQSIKPDATIAPVLTGDINGTVTTIPVSFIPAHWPLPPYVVNLDNEQIKITGDNRDTAGDTLTTFSGGNNGRGFYKTNQVNHTTGAFVIAREYYQTWAHQLTGYPGALPTTFDWSGGADAYGQYLRGVLAMYPDTSVGPYTGQAAYNFVNAEWLLTPTAVLASNDDPKTSMTPDDPAPPAAPSTAIGGAVRVSGAVTIH